MKHKELKTCMGKRPFGFTKFKWPFLILSVLCFSLSLYQLLVVGVNFGVDFLGGSKIVVQFDSGIAETQIREVTDTLNLGEVQVVPFGLVENNEYVIRAKFIEGKDVVETIQTSFEQKFTAEKFKVLSSESVGPKVGADLQKKGLLSILITCALILVYVGFRFDFFFAPGAVIALIHDVIISAGIFATLGKEFNLPILAALLTILGYSINDTIVVYDRVRENLKKIPEDVPLTDIIDVSLSETLSRTVVTSLTVFFVVVSLYLFGGAVLNDFAFVLMIGLVFGSYSTLFVASPFYVWLQRLFPQKTIRQDIVKFKPDAVV